MLTSSLTMISCTASDLNHIRYLCLISCCFQRSVWIQGLISFFTFFTLLVSTALRDSTLGGGSLTLGSSIVLGLADVRSAVVFVVASENIADSYLGAVKVLSLKSANFFVLCVCFNTLDNYNTALFPVLADDNVGILYCLGKNPTVSHTHTCC